MSVTFFTLSTISASALPDWLTSSEPVRTFSSLSLIRPLISFAAPALRWARLRTSVATTAKPRPCSPARAASTAALRASRLVWKAISWISPTMSPILRLEASISVIATIALPATSPPRSACSRAPRASWLAWLAFSAFCFTVEVISSIEEAVSSRLEACSWVRWLRSSLPRAICCAAVLTASEPIRTSPTISLRRWSMLRKASSRRPNSSLRFTRMSWPSLPSPMSSAILTACRSAPVIERISRAATNSASSRPATSADRVVACTKP